jgi:hypothetical protein
VICTALSVAPLTATGAGLVQAARAASRASMPAAAGTLGVQAGLRRGRGRRWGIVAVLSVVGYPVWAWRVQACAPAWTASQGEPSGGV